MALTCAILLTALSFGCGWLVRWALYPQEPASPVVITDTVTVRDTVIRLVRETRIRVDTVRLPVVIRDSILSKPVTFVVHDTVAVEVPIVQRVFTGEYYRAVVQGFRPELVSIDIRYPGAAAPSANRKWWSFTVGPQLGYGFTPKGWQPYTGVGVTAGLTF